MRLLVTLLLPLACLSMSPSSHLTTSDRARLTSLFSAHLSPSTEVSSLHYSILGALLLGEGIPDAADLCSTLSGLSDEASVETLFLASKAAAALSCPLDLGTTAKAAVSAGLDGSTASIFFAANTLVSTGAALDSAKVSKSLTTSLKKDDALLSLGLAFHTASLLEGDVTKFFDRIEDAVVQADEVDGKMLQFEGGLSVTSVVLTGAARLAVKAKKLLPVSGEQAVKFANYLMSRKSVQQAKGAFHLLDAVLTMANNPQHVPLSVSLASPVAVSAENPFVVVSVTNLAGEAVDADIELTLETATRLEDGAVVAAKQALVHMTTTTKYTMDLMAATPPAGFYELVLSATPSKPDPRYVGNTGVVLNVKVLATVDVEDAVLKVTDSEQSTDGKTFQLAFPSPASEVVTVDNSEMVQLTFSVLDSVSRKSLLVHQAFVKLTHSASGSEIIYVAEPDRVDDVYKFELDLSTAAGDLNSKSGEYLVTVILGDAVISNPTAWDAAKLSISFPSENADSKEGSIYEPKPEIRHLFREPEARPPTVVSTAFTLLCLSPFLLMLGLWAKLGVNISNFQTSLAGVGFHLGLGGIFLLYTYFWLQLNMFQTVKYLVVLGVVTFLCGNSLLSNIAKRNKVSA